MATIRENTVILLADGVSSAEYVDGTLTATNGQPTKEPPVINVHDGVVTILVHSGRKKSKQVAEVFNKHNNNAIATQGGESGRPDELNFTFAINLKFADGSGQQIWLGQGNRLGVRNNWWISNRSIGNRTVEPSSLNGEGVDISGLLQGRVPPKFAGLVNTLNKTLIKDLTKDVNVFKIV